MASREYRSCAGRHPATIDGIQRATVGKSLADYTDSWLLKHAVQRGIEIISEASCALTDEIKARRPEVPWSKVKAIGNVLRHAYAGLSDKIIWGVVVDELPRLLAAIEALSHFNRRTVGRRCLESGLARRHGLSRTRH